MSRVKIGHRKDQEIKKLYNSVDELFNQSEKMLDMSLLLVDSQDNDDALAIIEEDVYMDELHGDLILSINNFILREQPKAKDLRIALGIYAMSYDLERVSDYFKNFSKVIIRTKITDNDQLNIVKSLLTELKIRIEDTRTAFLKSSHELAKSIARRDFEIDELVSKLNVELTSKIKEILTEDEANNIRRVMLIAKGFERAGDHLVNMCEQISFIENGRIYNYS